VKEKVHFKCDLSLEKMNIVIRNEASGNSIDDGFGKQLRVITDSFGVEKCWIWETSNPPEDSLKDHVSGKIRSIRDGNLVFLPEGGTVKLDPDQPVHLEESMGEAQEEWILKVVNANKSLFYIANNHNMSWVLAEKECLLVLQNKGSDDSAQHWVIEAVGTSSYKQDSKNQQENVRKDPLKTKPREGLKSKQVAKKKNKVKGRKLSISSGDDSDEDENDEETGIGFDPDYPDQLLNNSDKASTSEVSTSSAPEVTPSAPEVTYSAPEVTYSTPSYDYSSYSGGGDSGGYSGGDSGGGDYGD